MRQAGVRGRQRADAADPRVRWRGRPPAGGCPGAARRRPRPPPPRRVRVTGGVPVRLEPAVEGRRASPGSRMPAMTGRRPASPRGPGDRGARPGTGLDLRARELARGGTPAPRETGSTAVLRRRARSRPSAENSAGAPAGPIQRSTKRSVHSCDERLVKRRLADLPVDTLSPPGIAREAPEPGAGVALRAAGVTADADRAGSTVAPS